MAWDDIVGKFEPFKNPAADTAPDVDSILAGVAEVYNQDIAIRDTAVKDSETKLAELQREKENLMLENYKLLMKQPGGNVGQDNGGNPPEPTESERAASVTFADIFKKN